MNLIPDALCFLCVHTVLSSCAASYLGAHTQAVFTQSVCLKKPYHTIHST